MWKPMIAAGAALAALPVSACGSQQPRTEDNRATIAGAEGANEASGSNSARPVIPADPAAEPVPPPDAVSHPDGYLPDPTDSPAPSEPQPAPGDPPGSEAPATEDQYMRNQQAGR